MIAGRSDSGKPTGTFLYYSSESNIQLGLFCLTPQMLYKAVTLPALLSKDLDQSLSKPFHFLTSSQSVAINSRIY